MEKKKKVMWTLPRNIIPANQQQVALVLRHSGDGGREGREFYTVNIRILWKRRDGRERGKKLKQLYDAGETSVFKFELLREHWRSMFVWQLN